eukprot:jgi/Botrbrau1/11714/Bobra.0195s0042.1
MDILTRLGDCRPSTVFVVPSILCPRQSRTLHGCHSTKACRPSKRVGIMVTRAVQTVEERLTGTSAPGSPAAFEKVKGKTVVITGSSQGIGRAVAMRFAREGYNVVVVARPSAYLEEAVQDLQKLSGRHSASLAVSCDITSTADVNRLAEVVCDTYDSVNVVVNNAGICMSGPLQDTSLEDFKQQMDVNFFGAVAISKAFMDALTRAAQDTGGATLAFVNSFGGRMPLRNMPAYTASKFALAGFVDSIRPELSDLGIQVAQIHPGVVRSDFIRRAQWRGQDAEESKARLEGMLYGQSGSMTVQTPEEVAEEVWQSVEQRRDEVFVGAFRAIYSGYRKTGANPFLLGPPSKHSASRAPRAL